MDLTKLPLFSMIAQRMGWLSDRQRVLADNIANADTPRFRAHDLAPLSFRDMIGNARSASATNPMHLSADGGSGRTRSVLARSQGKLLSGNTVSVNDEMMKVSETANEYSLVTNLYRKQIGMLRAVLNRTS